MPEQLNAKVEQERQLLKEIEADLKDAKRRLAAQLGKSKKAAKE